MLLLLQPRPVAEERRLIFCRSPPPKNNPTKAAIVAGETLLWDRRFRVTVSLSGAAAADLGDLCVTQLHTRDFQVLFTRLPDLRYWLSKFPLVTLPGLPVICKTTTGGADGSPSLEDVVAVAVPHGDAFAVVPGVTVKAVWRPSHRLMETPDAAVLARVQGHPKHPWAT